MLSHIIKIFPLKKTTNPIDPQHDLYIFFLGEEIELLILFNIARMSADHIPGRHNSLDAPKKGNPAANHKPFYNNFTRRNAHLTESTLCSS